jgi:hypothetical protein
MFRNVLIVAALLFSNLTGIAAAAEPTEQKSKNARKLLATLNAIGINNKDVQNLITEADAKVENKYFYVTDHKVKKGTMAGRWSMRYNLKDSDNPNSVRTGKRLQLHYAPKDSRFEVTAHTDSVMFNYRLQLQ